MAAISAHENHSFAIHLDSRRLGGGDVVFARGGGVAHVVQIGIREHQVHFIQAGKRSQTYERAAQINDDHLVEEFFKHRRFSPSNLSLM